MGECALAAAAAAATIEVGEGHGPSMADSGVSPGKPGGDNETASSSKNKAARAGDKSKGGVSSAKSRTGVEGRGDAVWAIGEAARAAVKGAADLETHEGHAHGEDSASCFEPKPAQVT